MSQVQIFCIYPISDQDRKNDVCLKDHKYIQYMGNNKNAAILCSLIHYAFNRKQPKILSDLTDLMCNSKNQSKYQDIVNAIKQSKDLVNPVQMFFQNLCQVDQKNDIAGKLLMEFCYTNNLLKEEQIQYNKLASFLKMRISFNKDQEVYCKEFKDSIDLIIKSSGKYFYLIPEPIIFILSLKHCTFCNRQTEFVKLNCQHQNCYICFKFSSKCEYCKQSYTRNQVKDQIDQIEKTKLYNQRSKELQKYYESTKQHFSNCSPDNKTKIKINAVTDTSHECNVCNKTFEYQLFISQACKHQYCYDCMMEKKYFNICLVTICSQKLDNEQYSNYLQKMYQQKKEQVDLKKENHIQQQQVSAYESRIMEQCSKCKTIQAYKLFVITNCQHKLCNSCLSQTNMKFLTLKCLVTNCYENFASQQYQNYIKQLQDLSKSDIYNQKNSNSQQILQQFRCDECSKYFIEDQKYVLNCGHSVCQQCILKDSFYDKCCQVASKDQQYKDFRKQIIVNCNGCQQNFPYKNLYQLLCNHQYCLSCCQKINQKYPYKCMICERIIQFIYGCNKFISDQIQEQNKATEAIKKQSQISISIQKEKELKVDQEIEKKDINYEKKKIIITEEEKIIEKNTIKAEDNNKIEEEKSLSVQNSAINLLEIRQTKKDENPQQQQQQQQQQSQREEFQLLKQNEFIQSNIKQNQILNSNKKKLNKQPFLEADQISQQDQEDIILYQQIDEIKLFNQNELESEFENGFCTNCNQEFSIYNRKQEIKCKSHQIGVCCILTKFRDCPQCEQMASKNFKITQTLILPTNPVEVEFIFEKTIPRVPSMNYYQQPFQQTSQGIERQRYNEYSSVKRNLTTDTVHKRSLVNQIQLEEKYKNRYDYTQQRIQPYPNQSYYPQKYDQSYKLMINNNHLSQNFRNPPYYQNRLV